MEENLPSFASSRSFGSVGLPFDDGMATFVVASFGGWQMGNGIVVIQSAPKSGA